MNTMSNEPTPTPTATAADQRDTALFAGLVLQQANMALIFLGRAPHPQTGETTTDTQAASTFIDTLEMLAAKTKGNLSKAEDDLLQQSLTDLRLAFVAAVDAGPSAPLSNPSASAPPPPPSSEPAQPAQPGETAAADPRKKFVKKY
jgi:hypothetical protein